MIAYHGCKLSGEVMNSHDAGNLHFLYQDYFRTNRDTPNPEISRDLYDSDMVDDSQDNSSFQVT